MRNRLLVQITIAMVFSVWATTAAAEIDLKPGMIFEHLIKPGSLPTQIALPEGKWELASFRTKVNDSSIPMLEAFLFQESEGKLSKFIWFKVSTESAEYGWKQINNCSRDNMHYRKTLSNEVGGVQDCRWLNHRIQYWHASKSDFARAFARVVTERRFLLPNHVVAANYRLADEFSFLQVRYYFNPAMKGFEDHEPTKWIHSIWSKSNVNLDLKKDAYINRLKAWTDEWYPTVKAGFDGKLTGAP